MTTRPTRTTRDVAIPGPRLNGTSRPVVYPESDGNPMAEHELHLREMIRLIMTLDAYYAGQADAHVAGNQLLYYEEGNPRKSISPDVYVALGVPKLPLLRTYQTWREGVPPTFVIEVTSPSTRREDLGKKRELCARLGVAEYVLYDPLAEYLRPPLQGHRLADDRYEPMPADEGGALLSEALGLRLHLVDGRLRLERQDTGALLLSPEERADSAEARVRELERRLAALESGDAPAS